MIRIKLPLDKPFNLMKHFPDPFRLEGIVKSPKSINHCEKIQSWGLVYSEDSLL